MKHIYDKKRAFVDSLNAPLKALRDFEAIEYARDPIQGDEYIRIMDKLGYVDYVNVTGNSEEAILLEVARITLGEKATGSVTSRQRIRDIAPMFRKAVS